MSSDRRRGSKLSSSSNVDYNEEAWVPKIKRRRRFTTAETNILESEFQSNSSPNQEKIQRIANTISTPRKIVTTWFQNRRAKNKRREKVEREIGINSMKGNATFTEFDTSFSAEHSLSAEEDDDEDNYEDDDSCGSSYIDSSADFIGNDNNNIIRSNYYTRNQRKLSSSANVRPRAYLDNNTTMISTTQLPLYSYNNRQSQFILPPQFNIYNSPSNFVSSSSPLPINNQLYNINIFNNMNNYFIQQEQQFGNINEMMYSNSNANINQQQLLNMLYCQQQFAPFLINNYNFPLQSPPENDPIYINPADLYLNSPLPHRYQQQRIYKDTEDDEDEDDE